MNARNLIDTMDYMGDWMDKVFEAELDEMFDDNPPEKTEEEKARWAAFEAEFLGGEQ